MNIPKFIYECETHVIEDLPEWETLTEAKKRKYERDIEKVRKMKNIKKPDSFDRQTYIYTMMIFIKGLTNEKRY